MEQVVVEHPAKSESWVVVAKLGSLRILRAKATPGYAMVGIHAMLALYVVALFFDKCLMDASKKRES